MRTVTQLESERSYGGAQSWATHHLKVSAHKAVEILLVSAVELRKQTTPRLRMQSQADQGSGLNGREKRSRNGKLHRELGLSAPAANIRQRSTEALESTGLGPTRLPCCCDLGQTA